ncbi:MAG: hypothetical protein ACRYGR_02300 [Janthinobacterium lividum]
MNFYLYIICLLGFLTLKGYTSDLDEKAPGRSIPSYQPFSVEFLQRSETSLPKEKQILMSNSRSYNFEISEEKNSEIQARLALNSNQTPDSSSSQSALDLQSWMRGYEEGRKHENYLITPHTVYAHQKDVLENIYNSYLRWVEKFIKGVIYMPLLKIEDFNHLADYDHILRKHQNFLDQLKVRSLLQKPTLTDFKKYIKEETNKNEEDYFKGIEENLFSIVYQNFLFLLNCSKKINNPADYRYVMTEVLLNLIHMEEFILKCDDDYQAYVKKTKFSLWERERLKNFKPSVKQQTQTNLNPLNVLNSIDQKTNESLATLRNQIDQKEQEKKNLEKTHRNKIREIANQKEICFKKLNEQKERVKVELENLQIEIKTIEDQISQATKTRDQLNNIYNNRKLRDQLKQAKTEINELQKQFDDLKNEQDEDKKKIIELEKFNKKITILTHDIDQEQPSKDELKTQLEQLRMEKDKLQKRVTKDQQTISKFQKSQRYFIENKRKLKQELISFQLQNKTFQERIFSLEQNQSKMTTEFQELQSCFKQKTKECDKSLAFLFKETNEKQELENKNKKLIQQNEKLKIKLENLQAGLDSQLPVTNTPEYLRLNKVAEFLFRNNSNLNHKLQETLKSNQKLLQENAETCFLLENNHAIALNQNIKIDELNKNLLNQETEIHDLYQMIKLLSQKQNKLEK